MDESSRGGCEPGIKLAVVLRQSANRGILDSYEPERNRFCSAQSVNSLGWPYRYLTGSAK